MPLEPAPHGAALAVLLVVTVLRPDELGLERHDLGVARRHDGGTHHRVEVLGRRAGGGAPRTVWTGDPGGAVMAGSVERAISSWESTRRNAASPPERSS